MSGQAGRSAALGRAGLLLAVVACPTYACQAFISAGSYFNANGVTYLAQYSELDPPPNQLTLTPNGLFFVEGNSVWVVATGGASPPMLVKAFSGPPTSLQFDGADTIFACDPTGVVFAASTSTLEAVSAPSVPAACLAVSASDDTIATVAVGDAGANDGPDAAVPLTLTIVTRSTGTTYQLPQRSLTTFDVTVASQGYATYATALGELHRYNNVQQKGVPVDCTLAFMGQTPRPKMLPLASADAGLLMLVRGRSDLVHAIDSDAGCCDAIECLASRLATSVQPGPGDFTLAAPYVYWSDQNVVKRQLLSDLNSGTNAETVVSVGDSTSLISELAADDQAVYVVIGSALLRAPLPATLGQ